MPTLMLIDAAWSLIRLRLAMGMGAGLAARLGGGRLARLAERLRRRACAFARHVAGPCPPLAACCR